MKQTGTSDFFRENFNNISERDVECSSFSEEHQDANCVLNDDTKLAEIPGEDFTKELMARLQNVIQVSKSPVGLLFASAQIFNDWQKLHGFGSHLGDWSIHLSQIIQNLKRDSDFETDRLQAKTIKNPVLKLLLLTPSPEYQSVQKDWVFAIRGLVVIQALVANKKPSTQLIAGLSKLFYKKPGYEDIANLNLTAIKEYTSNSNQKDHEVFLSTLQKLLTKPWVDLESFVSPRSSHLIQTSASSSDLKPEEQKSLAVQINNKKDDEQEYKTDLISYIKRIQEFLGEKQNVGVIERFEYTQQFEIEIIIPEIVEDLKDFSVSKLALATLLTFFLHCRPERFRLIAIHSTPDATAWLDIHEGTFCWSLSALIESNNKAPEDNTSVCIPLPDEILRHLRRLYHQHEEAPRNLGELFNYDMSALDAECKRYLRGKSLTSHRPRLSRLETSYSRYVLSHTNDEVYAAAVGLDFCIGTTSNFNYCVIRGNRLTQVLQSVYKNLGFTEQILVTPDDVGSAVSLICDQVWELVESISNRAYDVILKLPRNLTFQNIQETHNNLALAVGSLLVIFTGHRAAEAYTFSSHTVDLERKLCLICDKRVTDYQQIRLVPIPTLICQWLELYFRWLESLKYRLSSINKQLAFQVEAAINSSTAQRHPLLFTILNYKVEPFSSSDFSKYTKKFSLPTNCGRHFLDYVLRERGLDSAHIMALAGHANFGQEAFGPISLMRLIQVADKTRDAIDESVVLRKLAAPPKFNPRQYDCSDIRFPRTSFKNLFADEYLIKDPRSAQCPYDEESLESLNYLIKHSEKWRKAIGKITLNDLVYSLTLIDGIGSPDELQAVLSQILEGEIYTLDDRCFVDTLSKKLGVRRIWISFTTLLIAAALAEAGEANELKQNLNNMAMKSFYKSLIQSVSAHYSVYAPGMLSAWVRGEVCSRTIRYETMARHYFNCQEKSDFGFVESKRREVLLDDYLIRKAINRACDTNQNLGTNETRLKHLSVEINELLDFQVEEMSVLVLAKFTQYLISLQVATSTISRYYSVVRQFLDYFLDEVYEFSQLTQINWAEIIKNWQQSERIDAESGPEMAAVNHFLTFVESDIKIKGALNDLNSPVMEYADLPSQNEICKAFESIQINSELDDATKLKAKVMIGLLAQHALRPSEVRNIRVCDVYKGDPAHFVITSEAIGKVKTRNANRVLLLKDDQFSTRENLLLLCEFKTGFPEKAFLFGDNVDGSTLDGSQLIFNIVRHALSQVAGNYVSIMSFRHFNVTREVTAAIDHAGMDALHDRKVLSLIAARSGHGHARTSLQNYCCDLDRQRHRFWEQHRVHEKLSSPISEIKERMGLGFKGNLPHNKSSFLLLMQILRDQFPKTHTRIKNCQDFILKERLISASSVEASHKNLAASYRYCFYTLAGADPEATVFLSNILQREKRIIDEGYSYLKDTFNKDWCNSAIGRFKSIIQSPEFIKLVSKIGVMSIDDRDAIQFALAINDLNGKWDIKNLKLLDLLERNLPIFLAANIKIEINVNRNLQVNDRKYLRQKSFVQLSEKPLARDVFCQVSFWSSDMKRSMHAKHHQEIMIQLNLIFLTKAFKVLGELHGLQIDQ